MSDEAMGPSQLDAALSTVGMILEKNGHRFEVVAVGGGGLLLLGLIRRATKDLDIVAVLESGNMVTAKPLPVPLREAANDVGATLGLARDWLNSGPTSLLRFGLPKGFLERTERREYGGLVVWLASRPDQICFKFYAAADHGPTSKHFQDLKELHPAQQELLTAAAWAKTHDTSTGFALICEQVLHALGVESSDVR